MLRQPPASSLLYCSSRRGTELSVYELWKHGAWKKNWWDSQDGNSQDAAQKFRSYTWRDGIKVITASH